MFYAVEALLLTKEMSFSSHKAVISAFGEQFVKTGIFKKDFSKALTRAFEKRQIGDYEFTFTVTEKEANEIHDVYNDRLVDTANDVKGELDETD